MQAQLELYMKRHPCILDTSSSFMERNSWIYQVGIVGALLLCKPLFPSSKYSLACVLAYILLLDMHAPWLCAFLEATLLYHLYSYWSPLPV